MSSLFRKTTKFPACDHIGFNSRRNTKCPTCNIIKIFCNHEIIERNYRVLLITMVLMLYPKNSQIPQINAQCK